MTILRGDCIYRRKLRQNNTKGKMTKLLINKGFVRLLVLDDLENVLDSVDMGYFSW